MICILKLLNLTIVVSLAKCIYLQLIFWSSFIPVDLLASLNARELQCTFKEQRSFMSHAIDRVCDAVR